LFSVGRIMNSSRDQEWASVLRRAYEAGLEKGRTVRPPGTVVGRPDLLTGEMDQDSPHEYVADGPYGGAALEFSSDGSAEADDFLVWLAKERPTESPPPFDVDDIDDPAVIMTYIDELGQSAAPNVAAAAEMARQLQGLVPGLTVESREQLS
jgi:hypothetical protein